MVKYITHILLLTDSQSEEKGLHLGLFVILNLDNEIKHPYTTLKFLKLFLESQICNINAKYMAIIKRVMFDSGYGSMVTHLPGMCLHFPLNP